MLDGNLTSWLSCSHGDALLFLPSFQHKLFIAIHIEKAPCNAAHMYHVINNTKQLQVNNPSNNVLNTLLQTVCC